MAHLARRFSTCGCPMLAPLPLVTAGQLGAATFGSLLLGNGSMESNMDLAGFARGSRFSSVGCRAGRRSGQCVEGYSGMPKPLAPEGITHGVLQAISAKVVANPLEHSA
jgi:hypothetical protein